MPEGVERSVKEGESRGFGRDRDVPKGRRPRRRVKGCLDFNLAVQSCSC
jgi:hypothetical protein